MVSNINILLVQSRKKEETHVDGGTSSAGFLSKKLTGLNATLIISHGMIYSPLSAESFYFSGFHVTNREVFDPGNMVDSCNSRRDQ